MSLQFECKGNSSTGKLAVMVLAGIEFIFFIEAHMMLCFIFLVKIVVIAQ